jgi:hypothetical protein
MADLKQLSAPELRNTIERMKSRGKNLIEKGKKPLLQAGLGVSAVAGGALGGLATGLKPTLARVPVDAGLGIIIAVPCMFGAGSPEFDALAMAGYGMLAGAASRGVHDHVRDWRENRAADGGDASAKAIADAQKSLDALRKARDTAPAKKAA